MLCDYGCGQTATKQYQNGKHCCVDRFDQCPGMIVRRVKTREAKGPWHSEDTKESIKKSWIGRRRIDRPQEPPRQRYDENGKKIPWNKGLTAETDKRIADYARKQEGVPAPNRSHPNSKKGTKKQESLEIISRDDPVYGNFRKYRNRVAVRTRKTYTKFKHEINPIDLPLGKCGVDGAHQIDHIITVRQGFEQGIDIETISARENLQILPWLENVKKYDGKGLRK